MPSLTELCNAILSSAEAVKSDKCDRYTVSIEIDGKSLNRATLPNRGWDTPKLGSTCINKLTAEEQAAIWLFAETFDFDKCKFDANGKPEFLTIRVVTDGCATRATTGNNTTSSPLSRMVAKVLKSGTDEQREQLRQLVEPWAADIEAEERRAELEARIKSLKDGDQPLPSWVNEECWDMIPATATFTLSPVGMSATVVDLYRNHTDRIKIEF